MNELEAIKNELKGHLKAQNFKASADCAKRGMRKARECGREEIAYFFQGFWLDSARAAAQQGE